VENPSVFADFFDEFIVRGMSALIGLIAGGLITFAIARWRRHKARQSILGGDARDTVVIQFHVVETREVADPSQPDGKKLAPAVLRIRSVGQGELKSVIPNSHLAYILLRRAHQVRPHDTLISMEGAEGSYLLETLTGFVCDRVANEPFEHGLYVMAPCCEPAQLAHHQPIIVLLIAVEHLRLFESWVDCRDVKVEHGSDGARVLTLMVMAQRFKAEQERLVTLRQSGHRTQFVETMYILDLSLDRRAADIPLKEIPWGRFEGVLKKLNLE
jgi:hypothetical protein